MIAVIKTGSKQYKVAKGDKLKIEKIEGNVGDSVVFDKVLLLADEDNVKIGTPELSEFKIEAKILEQGKGPKIRIVKFKAKKKYRVRTGHRQPFTKVEITDIKK